MTRVGAFWFGMCLSTLPLSAQASRDKLPISQQEVEDATRSRSPFLTDMQARTHRGIFPDDALAKSLAGDRTIALVEVLGISPELFTNILSLQTAEILRGDVPNIFPTEDYGGPVKASQGILPAWGWGRIQAHEHKKYLVAVRQVRPPEKPRAPGEYATAGALDMQTDESEWLTPIRRLLAIEARSKKERTQALVAGLKDESRLVRNSLLWKLSKLCKLNSECWNATVDAEGDLLQHGDEAKREEAINNFETLFVRLFGLTLTFEVHVGKKRMVNEISELNPLDFSIDKDVSAPIFRFGTIVVRSNGPPAVFLTPGGQRVRQLLEDELKDPDLAIGDEAYSLLTLLRSGAPENKNKCSFVVPALRKSFDYSAELPANWPLSVQSLTHWSVCTQ